MSHAPESTEERAEARPAHRRPVPLEALSVRERVLGERINLLIAELDDAENQRRVARLQVQQWLAQRRGEARTLELFRGIAGSLASEFDLRTICDKLVALIAQDERVTQCSIMSVDTETEELRLEAGAANPAEPSVSVETGRRLRFGVGVAGKAAASREPILISDVLEDSRWVPGDSQVVVRSLLCLPLFGAGHLVGILNVSSAEPGRLDEGALEELSAVAPIVGQLLAVAILQEQMLETNRGLAEEVRSQEERVRETQVGLARREKLATLGETVSGLAHELNNRLVPLTMYTESLLEDRLAARQAKQVRAMSDAVKGVPGILDSLLGFARQRKPRKEQVNLNELIPGVVSVLKFALQRDGIIVRTEFAADLPPTMADPMQVEQVLLNLIQNAQHAIGARPDRGETGLVYIETAASANHILVRVRDNGCGIEPRILGKIMQPFFTTKPTGEGTGLGLSVCYGIMSEHGGDVIVDSRPGNTTFTLRFGICEPEPGDPASKSSASSGQVSIDSLENLRVLLVDDEEQILDVMHDVLDGRVQLDTANSGLEAIQKLGTKQYDVVVSDMRMPGIGGRDIYRWIKENRPESRLPGGEVAFVFATGDTFDPAAFDFIRDNDIACVAKPFTVKTLLAGIREATGR